MSRFVNLSVLIVGTLYAMQIWGIDTGITSLFGFFELPGFLPGAAQNFGTFGSFVTFTTAILFLMGTAVASAIVIGFFTKASFEYAILAGAATLLLILNGSFWFIASTSSGLPQWIQLVMYPFLAVFSLLYLYSAIEFVFNR